MNAANGLFLNKFLGKRNSFFEINFAIKMNDESERQLYTSEVIFKMSGKKYDYLVATTLFRTVKEWAHIRSNCISIRWNFILWPIEKSVAIKTNWVMNCISLSWTFNCILLTKKNSDVWIYFFDRYLSSTTSNFSRLPKPVYKSAKGKSFNEWVCTWTSYMITKVRLPCLKLTTGDLYPRPSHWLTITIWREIRLKTVMNCPRNSTFQKGETVIPNET